MNELAKQQNTYENHNRKNNTRYILWVIAWVGTMIAADKAVLYEWYSSDLVAISAIVINAILGLLVIFSFMQMLKGMDELQRSIQLNALALAVGVGFVSGFTYLLLATSGLISEAEISDILVWMSVAYMGTVIYGLVKYR